MTRVELAGVFIGVTLLALGVVATLAATLRLRRGSIALLMFGLWCALYGARLLASQPPVRAAVGGAPPQWAQFVALVTYWVNVPITIFVGSLIGVGWRHSIRWLVGAVTAFAVVATATDLISGIAGAAYPINTWVVLASISIGLVAIVHSYAARGERTPLTEPIVMVGGFVLVLFVINQNLGQIVGSPVNIEPIGVLVFILCLGYALGRSVFRAEAEFISVQRELETAQSEPEHGLILGFVPDAQYANRRVEPFAAGDRILLYSDGVLEARNHAGEFFDGERVARWLSTFEPTTAERFADLAISELTRWSDRGQFDDDVTFVVAEVTA